MHMLCLVIQEGILKHLAHISEEKQLFRVPRKSQNSHPCRKAVANYRRNTQEIPHLQKKVGLIRDFKNVAK